MSIASTDWMKPGRTLQAAVANIIAEAERDSSGRFVTHPTAAEIVLKSLRKAYSPPQVIEPKGLIAGCGISELTPATISAGNIPVPHPSFIPLRIAAALLGLCAVLALGFAPHWMPDNMLFQFIGGTTVAMAGGVEIAIALGVF